jgi:1-acyl-sn-glycerol-3-phosphate acyltransferase
MDFWYGWFKVVLGTYIKTLGIKAEYSGLEDVPQGPKILVGNHPNASDSFHLPFLFREKVAALVENDVMQMPVVGRWLQLADMIPVIAGRGKEALQAAQERLRQGSIVLIYPEGKLTSTHNVSRAGTGVARLALAANVPIVPFGVYVPQEYVRVFHGHSQEGRPTVGTWQMRGKTYFRMGKPLAVALDRATEESHLFYRRFTDEIMQTVASLAEQAKHLAGIK